MPLDPQFEQDLKKAGVTPEQFAKMTMRQRLDLKLPDRDWRKGWLGDTGVPSHPEMPDVTVGFHKNVPGPQQPPASEDEEVTIARAEREKAAQDPAVQDLAKRLGVPVHFLLDYRERAIGQFGPRLDRIEGELNPPPQSNDRIAVNIMLRFFIVVFTFWFVFGPSRSFSSLGSSRQAVH